MGEKKKFNFASKYLKALTEQYMLTYPDSDEKEVKETIKKLYKERYSNPKAVLFNKSTNLMKVIEYIEAKKPIITGYGTFFLQHSERKSVEYDLIQDFADMRSVYKKKKFEHINDKDKKLFNQFDNYQLTYKILNNSFYGASNESNSFFYHPLIGPSITQTGVVIITTSVNLFEKIMSANMLFRGIEEISLYVSNIIKEDYDIHDYIKCNIKKSALIKFLYDRCTNKSEKLHNQIKSLVNGLSKDDVTKVYFKNNFYQMIRKSEEFKDLLIGILGEDKFLDPNEPPEEYLESLNRMWEIFNTVCHYDYLDFYRMENAKYKKRKTILTVDTDSNFLYLYPFVKFCQEISDGKLKDTPNDRFITCNIVMYLLTKLIGVSYDSLTKKFGIQDESQRKLIAMKNEFYYSRIMLTESKKNYSGLILGQEGNILENPKHDVKGLAIKKVNTNKKVRDFYMDMLKNDILESDKINIPEVFSKYNELKETIEESISSGNIDFAIPGKVNEIESYKVPLQQQTVRGSLLWNELYPDKQIVFPDKVNYLKLYIDKEKDEYEQDKVFEIIDNDTEIDDEEKERIKDVINDVVYSNEDFAHYGMKIICFPKSVKKLPTWIIPMVDLSMMVENNLKPGYKILKSLDAKVLSYQVGDRKGEILSNIITI